MKKLLFFFSFLAAFFLTPNQADATHIMGGEVTWECNGTGQYIFTYRVYRDCSGSPIAPNSSFAIHNYPAAGQTTNLSVNNTMSQDNEISPACNPTGGVTYSCASRDPEVVFEYVRVMNPITLTGVPPASGWIVTYDDNARNASNNLPQTGITIRAKIFSHSGTVISLCRDDSPKFRERATSLLCMGSTFTYNHNATDDELDSLVYEWDRPLNQFTGFYNEGTNPGYLNFTNGYSFNNPFPGPESLNSSTGEITLSPPSSGKFISVVKVTAYKCGEKVAEIFRELQSVISANCSSNNNKPSIRAPFQDLNGNFTIYSDTVRAGDLVSFNIQTTDFPAAGQTVFDSVYSTSTGLQWGTGFTSTTGCNNPPCATVDYPFNGKKFLFGDTTRVFTWQTDCNHVSFTDRCISGQNTYTFVITALDDNCPIPSLNIATISITVVGDTVIESPDVNCVDVLPNGDVTLDWDLTPNINNSFTGWMIYSAPSRNGPFTLLDSVKTYSTTTYTHIGANANTQQQSYVVRSRSGCKGIVQNIAKDTVSTIFINATTNPTDVSVNWNPITNPNPVGSANQYQVFREYPIGSAFNLYQSTANTSLTENFIPCTDDVNYRVELVNSSKSCTSRSNTLNYTFKFPDPQTNFSFPNNQCPGASIIFTNQTTITGGSISYLWNFGDGSATTTQTSPSHTYTTPGIYNVSLIATSSKGCDSIFIQPITITFPAADAGVDQSICPGGSVPIGGAPTTTTGNTILWSPSAGLSSTAASNPNASPATTTLYTVQVTDANGCTNTDQVTVTVVAFPVADAGANQAICIGNGTPIGGSPTGPSGATYAWSPTSGLSNATIANPTANPTINTTYTVTVTIGSGTTCSATDQVTITVNPLPTVDAGINRTICNGGSVQIGGSPTSAPPGATVLWNNASSLTSSTAANPTANPTSTTTYTVLVTDGNGCTQTDQVTVTVNALPIADAGVDQQICGAGTVQIGGSPTGPTGSSYAWSPPSGLSSTNTANPMASPATTTTYTVVVTAVNGCSSSDQVTITNGTVPTADAGLDKSICSGTSTIIGGSPTGSIGTTVQWSPSTGLSSSTATNPNANPTTTTTYSVVVTAPNGCTSSDNVVITVNALPSADAGSDKIICNGTPVNIGGSPTSTTAGVTYIWNNSSSLSNAAIANPSANPTATTTYTVTVTSAAGCTKTDQVLVTVNSNPIANAGTNQVICLGGSTPIGGMPTGTLGSTFQWDNIGSLSSGTAANPIANPSVTTTYSVTVTSGVNCTAIDQATVTVNSLPTADAGVDRIICNGGSTQIGGSPTSTTAGVSYQWSNAGTLSSAIIANPSANPTTTTTYSVVVTDINGCTQSDQVIVTVNSLPIADAGVDQQICGTGSVQIGGSPTGPAGSNYAWSPSTGLSNTTMANPTANPTVTTTYTVVVTDVNGCSSSDQVLITNGIVPIANAGIDKSFCAGGSTTIGGAPTGSLGSTVQWSPSTGISSSTATNPTATPSATITYTVVVTAANGCTSSDDVIVTVNSLPTADAGLDKIICNGTPVNIGGSPTTTAVGATYLWNNSSSLSSATASNPSASPIVNTTYTVTVTNPSGCTNTDQVLVNVNSNPVANAGVNQTICLGQSTPIGGMPTGTIGSTFQWNNVGTLNDATASNPTANPIVTTTYTVTVTSGVNCTTTDQITITVDPVPTVDAGGDQIICNGGSVQIGGTPASSTTAGATFQWDNIGSLTSGTASNPTASPTVTTTYSVVVTHPNGCTASDQMVVTVNALPVADAGQDLPVCNGSSIQIGGSPTGPAGSTYQWSPTIGLSSSMVSNPMANPTINTTYTVVVTDINGCSSSDQMIVTVGTLPIADAGLDRTICENTNTILGGTPTGPGGSNYLWNNAATLNDATLANPTSNPISTTTYSVTVTDLAGCSQIDMIVVTVDPIPTVDAGTDQTICNGLPVQIGGSPTSSIVGATYSWDNGTSLSSSILANPTANPSVNTTYTVTVTHPNGCTNTDDVNVVVNGLPTADAGPDQTICNGGFTSIGGSPTGPTGATFSWDNTGSLSSATASNPMANPTVTTTYTVTITDMNGCINTDQVVVMVNDLPTVDAGTDLTICEGSSTPIGGGPTTSTTGGTFQWDNVATLTNGTSANPTANPVVTTTYTVIVTHPNGCTDSDMMTVTVNPAPTTDAGADFDLCIGSSTQIGGMPTGPVGATFAWDNAGSLDNVTIANPTANPLVTTTYLVTVTGGNGCTNTDDIVVTINPLPVADAGLNQTICDGENVIIGGMPTGPIASTYLWDNPTSLDNAMTSNPIADPIVTTTYTVTVTDINGCVNTDQVVITVLPLPNVDAGLDQAICNMQTVIIGGTPTSTTVGASYAWDNAGSLSSTTVANPMANPIVTTTYSVTVTHPNMCTATDQVVVTVNGLPIVDAGVDQDICINGSTQIGGMPTGPVGSTYQWDNVATLTNGTDPNPSANPIVTTTYSVTVTDLNGCTGTDQTTITVNPLPMVDAGADQTICNTDSATLGGAPTTVSIGATYAWDNVVSLNNATVSNPKAGPLVTTTYTVTVTDINGCTETDQIIISVDPIPVVDYSVANTCINELTQFTDASSIVTGSLFSWSWNFGDGVGTSVQQSPSYQYTAAGTYSVKLIVTSMLGCSDSITKTVIINPLPVVDFNFANLCLNNITQFTDGSTIPTGMLGVRTWDFGDGSGTSTMINPTYTYAIAGTYIVKLVVESGFGCKDSIIKSVTINPLPTVDAGADQVICNSGSVTLGGNPTSTTTGVTYIWDNASSLSNAAIADPVANPIITTTYTVTVTETLTGCFDTDQVTVTVNPIPVVDFTFTMTCFNDMTQFSDASSITVGTLLSSRLWDFGDGIGTSTAINPSYQYTMPGTYSVKLITESALGCKDSITKTVVINPLPTADAGADQMICNTDSATLGGSPTTNSIGATYLWNNSASLSSAFVSNPKAGPSVTTTYTVTITDLNGCIETDQVVITVNPLPAVDFTATQVCLNVATQFTNTSTIGLPSTLMNYDWDFGDGVGISSLENPNYNYLTSGTFAVKLIVTSSLGCMDSIIKNVFVDTLPAADAGSDRIICEIDTTQLGKTTIVGESYLWDNAASLSNATISNPRAFPITTTTYTVTVTNTNGCTNVDAVIITVNSAPNVDAGTDLIKCKNDTMLIGGAPTSSTIGVSYKWNNGGTLDFDTLANPKAFPTDTTTYIVTVTDGNGCTSQDTMTLFVNPVATVDFRVDAICEGDFAAFTDESTIIAGTITSWDWKFGDGVGTSTLQNPGYQYMIAGTYDVVLKVTSNRGCSESIMKQIVILEVPIAAAGGDKEICFGDTVELGSNPTGSPNSTYAWSPAFDLSSNVDPNPNAYPLSTTIYFLQVTNANGCFNFDTVEVKVNALPNVTAEVDSTLCKDQPVQLQANGATTYSWSPTNYLDNPLIPNPIARALKDVDYVVFGTDANGCIDTDTVKISVFNIDFTSPDTMLCSGDSIQLIPVIQGDTNGISYSWTPITGLSGSTVMSPKVSPNSEMLYYLEILNGMGCTDRDSINVAFFDPSGVDFEYLNSPRCSGAILEMENTTTTPSTFLWKLNGLPVSEEMNPKIFINNLIENEVTLIGTNANCTDSITKIIPAEDLRSLLKLKDANVFTPNGDGINDIFDPGFEGEFIGCVDFRIYDRWGTKVFDSNIGQYGWDGVTLRGQPAPNGIYYYFIVVAGVEIKNSIYLNR